MIKLNSEIRLVPVDNIVPYVRNARTHGDEQIAQIAGSMQEFGFTNPILLDGDNGVIAGHGRLIAARKLGLTEVPCINLGYLTKTQRQALVLADNKLAMNAGWDADMLGIELRDLDLADFDMDVIGFAADELADLLGLVDEVHLPVLADGEKEPFQQKTFTLHDEQAEIVDAAIMKARVNPLSDTGINENSNGNALAFISEEYMHGRG